MVYRLSAGPFRADKFEIKYPFPDIFLKKSYLKLSGDCLIPFVFTTFTSVEISLEI